MDVLDCVSEHNILPVITNETVTLASDEFGLRGRVDDCAMDILSEVGQVQPAPPAPHLDVLEDKTGAGDCLVASNNARRQDCIIDLDVAQSDVIEADKVVRFTWCKWI